MPENRVRIPVITGPTGVGKSRAAVLVAERRGAEIISADSRQIYRGLEIGTAAPDEELRRRIPHHMVGLLDPSEPWSSGTFARQAIGLIEEIGGRGAAPIVTGGSGFYIRALTEGLFQEPEIEPKLRETTRETLRGRLEDEGQAALYAELELRDPAWAASIEPTDTQRLVRGLESLELYGVPLSELQKGEPRPPLEVDWRIILLERDRQDLYSRINQRVERMLEAGWVAEARKLLEAGVPAKAPGLTGLGYDRLYDHLGGLLELEDAVSAIQQEHRNYAKRQLTWFRSLEGATLVHLDPEEGPDETAQRITQVLDSQPQM